MPLASQFNLSNKPGDNQQPVSINFKDWFANSYAYFIGISNYHDQRIPSLQSPANDIEGLRKVLEDKTKHGFIVKDVAHTGDDGSAKTWSNPLLDPGKQQVLDFIKNIQCERASRVVVYFACHGIAEKTNADGSPEGFLVASDAVLGDNSTYVRMDEVHEALCNLPCRHLLIILDCCYAGAFRWAEVRRGIFTERPERLYYQKFRQYVSNDARQVITSTSSDQQAMDYLGGREEGCDPSHPTSPFANCLIRAFSTGEADITGNGQKGDGIITVTELGLFLKDQLNNLQLKQIPAVWAIGDATKGEFVFINPTVTERALLRLDPNRQNPYKGLESYSAKDKDVFFGRKQALEGWKDGDILYPGLIEVIANNKVILVTGRSGTGKSSLVKAGVLSSYPVEAVVEIKLSPRPFTDNRETLELLGDKTGLCVFADQYEELVTNCNDDGERDAFEQALSRLTDRHKVIMTLRSDFEIQFKNSPLILGNPGFTRFAVPTFTRDNYRDIVVEVAARQALEFRGVKSADQDKADEAFVNRIIDDANAYPDSLPLLSLALSRLFDARLGDNLDNMDLLPEEEYNRFKGITGIVEEQAENEYTDPGKLYEQAHPDGNYLPVAVKQQLMLQLVFRMISFESAEITKRRIYLNYTGNNSAINELQFNDAAITEAMDHIWGGMRNARLLKVADDESGNKYVEPAHDALLRSWPRLTMELKKRGGNDKLPKEQQLSNQEKTVLLRQVSELAREYYFAGSKEKKDLLWIKDYRLHQVMDVKGDDLRLNQIEEEFITASANAKKRNRVIRYSLIGAAFAATLVALTIFIIQNNNIQNKAIDIQNKLAENYRSTFLSYLGSRDMLKSYLYLNEAIKTSKDENLNNLMKAQVNQFFPTYLMDDHTFLSPDHHNIESLAVSADGRLLLAVGSTSANVWDIGTRKLIFSATDKGGVQEGKLYNGTRLYLRTQKELQRWNIRTKKKELSFPLPAYSGGWETTWDLSSKKILVSGDNVAFLLNPDFKRSSWTISTGEAALSGDGKRLATYIRHPPEKQYKNEFSPGSIAIWEVDGLKIKLVNKFQAYEPEDDFKLSRNGNFLISLDGHTGAGVYNVKTGLIYRHLVRRGPDIVTFSQTQNEAFFSDEAEHFFGLDLTNPSDTTKHYELTDNNYNGFQNIVTFSAKSKYRDSILIDQPNGLGYWNTRTGQRGSKFDFSDPDGVSHRILYDSVGQKIICLTDNLHLRVYGMNGKVQELESYAQRPPSLNANLRTMQLSPDRKTLFVAAGPRIYDYALFDPEQLLPSKAEVVKAFFSADGKYTFTIDKKNTAKIWKHEDGQDKLTNTFSVPRPVAIDTIVFSKNGQSILTEWDDGKYWLINGAKWQPLNLELMKGRLSNTESGNVVYISRDSTRDVQSPCMFSDDGQRLLFVNNRQAICSYDIKSQKTRVLCYLPYHAQNDDVRPSAVLLNPNGESFLYPDTNSETRDNFRIVRGKAVRQGKITLAVDFVDPLIEKFINSDSIVLFGRNEGFASIDIKKQQVHTIALENFGNGDTFNKVFLSNDGKKLIIVYRGYSVSMFDVDTRRLNFSTNIFDLKQREISLKSGLIASDEDDDFSIALNGDYSQLALMSPGCIYFVDTKTGKTIAKNIQTIKRPGYTPKAVFDGYNLRYFDGAAVKTIGADLDLPADLFDLQTSVITGYRLNKATNQPEVLSTGELAGLKAEYETGGARHYAVCKYKQFNIWKQLKDRR